MNKAKIISLLSLSTTALVALASCGGNNVGPKEKPGVFFYAKAVASKEKRKDSNSKGKDIRDPEFKDEECATITVDDYDKLEYGKTDVVIHIKPRTFFTFRSYDQDWKPTSDPVKPYVGLGSPLAKYQYPLAENVAWTFEDESVFSESGYITNEQYKVTVKKEYFKKNIIIDYGNANEKDAIYAIQSSDYSKLMNNSKFEVINKTGYSNVTSLNNFFSYNSDASDFSAASNGMTVTFDFNKNDNTRNSLLTPRGWISDREKENEEGIEKYKHFDIYGVNDKGPTLLSKYDTNKSAEEQDFMPTLFANQISFFFNWKLLAGDISTGYATKFTKFEFKTATDQFVFESKVNVEDNTANKDIKYKDYYSFESIAGADNFSLINFKTDRFYYPQINGTTSQIISSYSFYNCNVVKALNDRDVPYGIIIVQNSPHTSIQWPNVSVTYPGGSGTTTTINLDKEHKTDFRVDQYGSLETELDFKTDNDSVAYSSWAITCINPTGRKTSVPEVYQEQNNLFYLYPLQGYDSFYHPTDRTFVSEVTVTVS